jgi:hypothetical protein
LPANLEVSDLHLFDGETALMDRILGDSTCVLEFGPGNCALRALALGAKNAVVVDPDLTWITKFQGHADVKHWIVDGALRVLHANIGPVDEWGNPTDPYTRNIWPDYIARGWSSIESAGLQPDLILLDGRLRVAGGLSALCAMHGAPFKLALHDAGPKRPYYKPLLEFYDIEAACNTLVLMVPRNDYSGAGALSRLLKYQYDVR